MSLCQSDLLESSCSARVFSRERVPTSASPMDDAVGTVVERAGAVECAANEDARERADASVAVAVVTAVRGCPSPHSAAASALVSGLLTADAERVRRKARWVDAWRTAVGCALASLAAPPTLRVARAASGRPYVAHADGVACAARDVSIAHHGDWVLVAALTDAAGWRVGVDVVSVRDAPETSAELARVAAFLGTSEAAGVARAPDAEAARRAFCVAWAAKEAFVKVRCGVCGVKVRCGVCDRTVRPGAGTAGAQAARVAAGGCGRLPWRRRSPLASCRH